MDVDQAQQKLSPEHPYPTRKLGYELTGERIKQKRKPPISRINSPTVQRKWPKKVLEEDFERIHISTTESEPHLESQSCNCEDYKARIRELEKEVLHWKSLYYHKQEK